jgi:uroporphyrinogen-III synthase
MALLITRPEQESKELQEYLGDNIQSFIFPTLTICKLTPSLLHTHYTRYQVVVFISKNAVDYGIEYLEKIDNPYILAVGSKTAKQLQTYGFDATYPTTNPSSKSLLAMENVANITSKNILIVRGKGGAETLKKGFIAQNNNVDYLEVYERKVIENNDSFKDNLHSFLQKKRKIILITSCDILDGLLHLTPIDKTITLLVVSKRIKKYANSLGFSNIIISTDMSNESIKRRLEEWLN